MKRLYFFTLEIVPLEVARTYGGLPSHLTLMSRFLSDLPPDKLARIVSPLFTRTNPVTLAFGDAIELGPKKVVAHMVDSADELALHNELCGLLDSVKAESQYPQFIGAGHRPHVTKREAVQFKPGDRHVARAAYLVEVVNKERVVRTKFDLKMAC